MSNINLMLLTLFLLLPLSGHADTPAREPSDYFVCSSKRTYCAYVSITEGIKVFEVGVLNKKYYPLTAIVGWYPQVFLSNDGKKVVTVGTTIVPSREFDQSVVKIWIGGQLIRSFLVRDLVGNHKTRKTTSGFHWGEPVGFDSDESFFSLRLDDGTLTKIPTP